MYSDQSPTRPRGEKALYSPSPSDGGSEQYDVEQSLLYPSSEAQVAPFKERQHGASRCSMHALIIFNILLFTFSVTLFVALPFRRTNSDIALLKQTSAYSPVLDSIDLSFVDQQVSGKLFPRLDGSDLLGRKEPGPATDDLWWDFELQRMFAISSDEIRKLGKDPATTIKFPLEYGLGDDAYMGALDSFHQIHCLNVLRKEAFKDFYWDGEQYHTNMYSEKSQPVRKHSAFFWIHLRHCTDMLLQELQCSASTEMITMTWLETQNNPWPDFNVNKKCKDFDALRQWRDDHAEPMEKINDMVKPYDLQKVEDRYFELWGNETTVANSEHLPCGKDWDC